MTRTFFMKSALVLLSFLFTSSLDNLANAEAATTGSVSEQIAKILLTTTGAPTYDSTSAASTSTPTSESPETAQHLSTRNESNNISDFELTNETSGHGLPFVHQIVPSAPSNQSVTKRHRSKNYASSECAKVIESNPEAKKSSHIINEMIDEYMLNPCKTKIWFVIELCEIIQATQIEIANYELYSSTLKDFTVYFSDSYPASDWKPIGHFTATDTRSLQTFELNQLGFGKFIRVELNSHYGNEHYCVISEVKVYGASMVDEYEKSESTLANDDNNPTADANSRLMAHRSRKTSAYRVYRNMMVNNPNVCQSFSLSGLSPISNNNQTKSQVQFDRHKEQMVKQILPSQPTQQPILNRTSPLKPSIFVELSNKLKALELSLKTQIEDMEKRLSDKTAFEKETEAKVDRLKVQFESFALIMIAYYVYKLMMDLM